MSDDIDVAGVVEAAEKYAHAFHLKESWIDEEAALERAAKLAVADGIVRVLKDEVRALLMWEGHAVEGMCDVCTGENEGRTCLAYAHLDEAIIAKYEALAAQLRGEG